ncbi:MAG: hypothetical protein HYT09_01805 [Candidatus Levybacteria bacterium]|nr:hypothetical protein [Candidatus Levybacteria bacterium]
MAESIPNSIRRSVETGFGVFCERNGLTPKEPIDSDRRMIRHGIVGDSLVELDMEREEDQVHVTVSVAREASDQFQPLERVSSFRTAQDLFMRENL